VSHPPVSEALRQLLQGLPARIPPERIDRVWLFAPREVGGKESGLVVLSVQPAPTAANTDQRLVLTLRYEAERTRTGVRVRDTLAEQGAAPADRIPRLIEGVLARLKDAAENPLARTIAGSPARWAELLRDVGAAPVDPGSGE
jgi:hypothetical protein